MKDNPVNLVYKHRYLISLFITIIFANVFSIIYVNNEKYIYFWDFSTYWVYYSDLGEICLRSPVEAIKSVFSSVRNDDYNILPVVPLIPFYLLLGDSRISFILAMVNTFFIPTVLIFTFLSEKLIKSIYTRIETPTFFLILLSVLLFWPFWAPLLRGDAGVIGLIFIGIILLIYIYKPIENQNFLFLLIIGVLLSLLALSRRWYYFWVFGFFLGAFIERAVFLILNKATKAHEYYKLIRNLSITGFTFVFLIILFSTPVLIRILRTNYHELYPAYTLQLTWIQRILNIENQFGLLFITISTIGSVIAFRQKSLRNISFFLIIQVLIISIMFIRIQVFDVQHLLLIAPNFLLLAALFIAQMIRYTKRLSVRLSFVMCYVFILVLIFSFVFIPSLDRISSLSFASPKYQYYPLKRNDISEIYKIVDTLKKLIDDEPAQNVHVLASSKILNSDILRSAAGSKFKDSQLPANINYFIGIDKIEGFPVNFLDSKYIIIADPIQYHLSERDQQAIGIPARKVLTKEGIGDNYRKLPYFFSLDNNVKVYIYEKVRAHNYEEIRDIFREFVTIHPEWSSKYNLLPLNAFLLEKKIGDGFGMVAFSDDHNIFVHPGTSIPTELSFKMRKNLKNLVINLYISELPKSCGDDSGKVEFTIQGDGREILRKIVEKTKDQQYEVNLEGIDIIKFIVDSSGSPNCDWFNIKVTGEEWITKSEVLKLYQASSYKNDRS